MAKKKKISTVFSCEVYPFDIFVSIGQSNEDFVKDLELLHVANIVDDKILITMDNLDNLRGRTVMTPQNQTILRLNFYPECAVGYSILAHEIFHATEFILHRVRMKLCLKSDESYAYLLQFITKKIYLEILNK